MKTQQKKQQGSIVVWFVIIGIIVLIGALGFLAWKNFFQQEAEPVASAPNRVTGSLECTDGDERATGGVFCSEEIGVTFAVPDFLSGAFVQVENEPVFQSGFDIETRQQVATTDRIYEASLEGADEYTLMIKQQPIYSSYVDFGFSLSTSYFDAESDTVFRVVPPSQVYDAETDTTTEVGEYRAAEAAPHFYIDDLKVYRGGAGDAGYMSDEYLFVLNDKIVIIKLIHNGYIGDPANDPRTIDENEVFEEFEASMRALRYE